MGDRLEIEKSQEKDNRNNFAESTNVADHLKVDSGSRRFTTTPGSIPKWGMGKRQIVVKSVCVKQDWLKSLSLK
jgi:hypothetical protein